MHRHHAFWWHLLPHKKLTQFYLSFAIRSFAISLIGLFIPLYLYNEIGFSLNETLMFYVFYSVVFAVTTPLAAKFSSRFGVKHSVLFSMPFYILFVVLLYFLPRFSIPLIILSIMAGTALSFYWLGMHPLFYKITHPKKRGKEFGTRTAFKIIASTLGPLIGGLLIVSFGFGVVFCVAVVLLLISTFILFMSKETHLRYRFSMRSILNKEHWKDSLFFVSKGSEVMANQVIWPLFIFVILGGYFSLGVVGSILAGVSAILVFLVGKYSDHKGKRKIIRWITAFESLSWFARALVRTISHVFGATIFGALTTGIKMSPIGALEYDKAKGNIAGYFVSREVFICIGRILMLSFVLMTNSLSGGLIFQGFANLAVLLF